MSEQSDHDLLIKISADLENIKETARQARLDHEIFDRDISALKSRQAGFESFQKVMYVLFGILASGLAAIVFDLLTHRAIIP